MAVRKKKRKSAKRRKSPKRRAKKKAHRKGHTAAQNRAWKANIRKAKLFVKKWGHTVD